MATEVPVEPPSADREQALSHLLALATEVVMLAGRGEAVKEEKT